MMKIGTVISYCTLDYRFIQLCVNSAKQFSHQTVVVVADHFFDGTAEDTELLERTYRGLTDTKIVEYKWEQNSPKYWHNMSRWIGLQNIGDDIDFVLFLDADEIIDADRLKIVLTDEELFNRFDAFLFYCYWYFREAKYRAKTWEDAGLLVKRALLSKKNMFTYNERVGILQSIPKAVAITGIDGFPLVHHYSWVRTKDEMLRKVKSWGHRNDTNWEKLIEEEFTHDFNGTDFLPGHNYQYDIIERAHDIKL
jgi:hypothetical protein